MREIGRAAGADETVGPLVSVITPTFNASAVIRQCLASVQAQDYPLVEHIIIDGGSTDGTVDLLGKYAKPGSWISERDAGLFFAWNKGLQLAKGEWIAFLGADDKYLPGAISSYMKLAAENRTAKYLSSKVRWISPKGNEEIIGQPWQWPRFQRYMCTAHVGSMQHRSLYEQLGTYDTSLRIVADYELLLRAGPRLQTAFLPEVTVEMLGGGNSDRPAALLEGAKVKRSVGKRAAPLVALEWIAANIGYRVRRAFY